MKSICCKCASFTEDKKCPQCGKGPLCPACFTSHVEQCVGESEIDTAPFLPPTARTHRSIRAPLNYPGSKQASLDQILPILPYRGCYVEPFGGSAAVLLARNAVSLEVYNDKYGGIVAFYRCLHDPNKVAALMDRIDLTIHSREEWEFCFANWQDPRVDDVERAARWYYMRYYSFSGKGAAFGRNLKAQQPYAGKLRNRVPDLAAIHERLKNVQIENLDWREIVADYDQDDAVFYMDPPYYEVNNAGIYTGMSQNDHRELLDTIFSMKGFVALSGYANNLYDQEKYHWDNRIVWKRRDRMNAMAFGEHNNRTASSRELLEEVLWVKE